MVNVFSFLLALTKERFCFTFLACIHKEACFHFFILTAKGGLQVVYFCHYVTQFF